MFCPAVSMTCQHLSSWLSSSMSRAGPDRLHTCRSMGHATRISHAHYRPYTMLKASRLSKRTGTSRLWHFSTMCAQSNQTLEIPELSGKGREHGVVTFIFAAFSDVRIFGRLVVTWVRLAHFAWCRCFRWIVFFVCGTTES